MAASVPYFSIPFICLLIVCFNSGGVLSSIHGQAHEQGYWCVAKPSSSDEELTENINYACGFVDCSVIQKGGPCFYPETQMNHASVAMNLYYQKEGKHFFNCDFKKSGVIVVTDPSYDDCIYECDK